MTEASIPPQPTQSLLDTAGFDAAGLRPVGGDAADAPAVPDPDLDGLDGLDDLDDLVIEDLTDACRPAVAPRICICTFSGE